MKILKARDGYKLTQSKNVDLDEIIITDIIYLGIYDNEQNYIEITNEQADLILKKINI